MTVVKAEPSSENIETEQEVLNTKKSAINPGDDSPNRHALTNKSINQTKPPHSNSSKEKEQQLRKFESFFLKPGQTPVGKESLNGSVKAERERVESPIVSSAATPDESSEIPRKRPGGKEEVEEQSCKKRELNERFEELSNFVEDRQQSKHLDNPGEYVRLDKLLYEAQEGEDGSIFQELEQQSEREFCTQASSWSLQDWVQNGQQLLNTHTKLVGKLIKHRIELSVKFQVITDAINDRADALNAQGILVDEKLQRIKTLGEEILHII